MSMKPDGKIQGVDVWVRRHFDNSEEWCIADGCTYPLSFRWLKESGKVDSADEVLIKLFPSREAALAHMRQLEAKERPMIDLTTAKFGDRFIQRDGSVSPPYACLHCNDKGWHVMQDGTYRRNNGKCHTSLSDSASDLIAPYVEPRTRTPWVMLFCDSEGDLSCEIAESEEGREQWIAQAEHDGYALLAQKQTPITEGEGLTQPDVV